MTELRKLLEDSGIRKAVVIDDVFDDAPRPDELNEGDWSNFFDDLSEAGNKQLAELFPAYETMDRSDLQESQNFIDILWDNRTTLPSGSSKILFVDYETTNATERARLEDLVRELESFGLTCEKMGRDLQDGAKDADLIVIDLFLGRSQSGEDMARAVRRAKDLVKERINSPPLVILTSRSHRLNENRDVFRDEAGLLGSTFRVESKKSLINEGKLEAVLTRLAQHYEDAKRVAGFVHAWDTGLEHARKNFVRVLRRLDLSDLAQTRALLLDFEGQKLGEYLLDVADRVLQHEIEDDDDTIAAALELNKINLERYPAPHLAGSPDLQELVHRMVFQHPDRLRLSEADGKVELQFGDVLRWKTEDARELTADVSLVMTPACDLVRDGAERVLLLSGTLESLQPRNWSYKAGPVRTAIVILPDEDRKWIRWNLKNVSTLSWGEVDTLIGKQNRLTRIGRLRAIYAIEIQQMLLTDMGRIGRPANMPVPFPVTVSLFYVDTKCTARRLEVEGSESAACYVGRGASTQPVHRLVLTEQTCDQIKQKLQILDINSVRGSARASLAAVKEDKGFFTRFERGEIEMSPDKGTKFIKNASNNVCAAIIRGEDMDDGTNVTGDSRKAALIVKVTDIPEEDSV